MRVLMLNNEFPPLGGGTGTVNKAILDRLLRRDGIEVDLITSALGGRHEEEDYAPNTRLMKVPVNNRNLHHSSGRELLTYAVKALTEARRQHAERPYDVCFAWSAVPAGWVARRLLRTAGLRYIVRVCGVDIPGFEDRYRYIYPILAPLLKRVWRSSECVVTKCVAESEMLRQVDATVLPVMVPNGVALDAFRQSRPPACDEPLRLICVGRLIERKGQAAAIRAVAQLAQQGHMVELELVGTGDAEVRYKRFCRNLGVADRVRFAGYVPREDIAERYARAHVFVLPSQNEGMSVSTLEAMAAGLPLIVTRTGGADQLVEEGVNGYFVPWNDSAALVSAIARFAQDHQVIATFGAASRERAGRFTWDAVVDRYVEMLAGVVGQG